MYSRQDFLTFCILCSGHCSRKATVEDGNLIEVERELESGLATEFCPPAKAKSLIELQNHTARLRYPQKREGTRGEGRWKKISWDEALDTVAKRLLELKEKYGPECVALGLGEPKGMEFAFAQRFASAFGTPNVATPGHLCGVPGAMAAYFTQGEGTLPDNDHLPRLIVLWGSNPIHTSCYLRRETVRSALIEGAKLAVINPKKIDIARRADLWIRPRPASDGALAMGFLKVVIEEELFDEAFVAQWTFGFERLQEHVKSFSLEDVERVTWVPREQIVEFARLYAKVKPGIIPSGNAIDQSANSLQAWRAICILRAIVGNVGVPGGEIFVAPAPYTRGGRFMLLSKNPRTEKTVGSQYKLAMRAACVPTQMLVKAILEEKPNPIRAALFILSNPLLSYPNAAETYKALKKLDFLVVSDIFMTPTGALADILLPAAHGMEHDTVGYWPADEGEIRAYPKLVEPPGESWSDIKWINELAKRMGLGEHFFDNENKALDLMLQPTGLSFEDFKKKRILKGEPKYMEHEKSGFKTPSKKVEIYSNQLGDLGYSPMPMFEEVSRFRFNTSEDYPLLMTNAKESAFYLSGYRQISYLRKITPEPLVELNPETAGRAGLKEGDWIYIETPKGRIKQKLALDPDLDPRVVFAAFGWYFPEKSTNLFEWDQSNLNMLTENSAPHDPAVGSVELRGISCRVYKA